MGAYQSSQRFLSNSEVQLDNEGKLYKTIGQVWSKQDEVPFKGSYSKALNLRHDKRPRMYDLALAIHHQGDLDEEEVHQAVQQFQEFQTATTITSKGGDDDDVEVSQTELVNERQVKSAIQPLTKEELTAEPWSITRSDTISRAHLIPDDEESRRHWDKIVEVACGFQFDQGHERNRRSMTGKISTCRANNLLLNGNHQSYFDHLGKGILLAVPLLHQEEIASWQHKDPYKLLILCDSPKAYRLFAASTNKLGCDWAKEQDLDLARRVLVENTKILADSLVTNWEFHDSRGEDWRTKSLRYLRQTLQSTGNVRVPAFSSEDSLMLNPLNPLDNRVRVLVIDLGKVYEEEKAVYIPDPWLLAFKSASNWSYFAYGKYDRMILKILPACGGDDVDLDRSAEILPEEFGDLQFFLPEYKKHLRNEEIKKIQVIQVDKIATSDDASLSSVSSDEAPRVRIVSDDSSC